MCHPTEVARGRFFGGAPDDVIEGIAHCRDLTGCTHISVGFGGGLSGRPEAASSIESYEDARDHITRLVSDVMPAFTT